jgi:hypothetical protein
MLLQNPLTQLFYQLPVFWKIIISLILIIIIKVKIIKIYRKIILFTKKSENRTWKNFQKPDKVIFKQVEDDLLIVEANVEYFLPSFFHLYNNTRNNDNF